MIVNGSQQQNIDIADRAFQYGDGCFTTMAFRNGHLELFEAHIERLKWACRRLFIEFDKWSKLKDCILDSIKSSNEIVVKVMITRGSGGRGYHPEGAVNPRFIITHHPLPTHYSDWQRKGISVTTSPIELALQPLLAGIKHLNRLEQVLIKQALAKTPFDDAIVCDTRQQVVESSMGNLFWYNKDVWYTADLSGAGVEGVMRNLVLDVMQQIGQEVLIVKQGIHTLFSAQEIFVCNALMKLVPITSVFDHMIQKRVSYPIKHCTQLQQHVHQAIKLKAIKV